MKRAINANDPLSRASVVLSDFGFLIEEEVSPPLRA